MKCEVEQEIMMAEMAGRTKLKDTETFWIQKMQKAKTFWIEKVRIYEYSYLLKYGTKILKSPGASACTSPRHRDWLGCSEKGVSLVVLAGVCARMLCVADQSFY